MGVYPGGAGDVLTSGKPSNTSNNSASGDNYAIVADVTVSYKPGFGFQTNNWSQSPNGGHGYLIAQSTYMTPRNGATTPIVWANGGTITTANDCTKPSLNSGVSNYGPPLSSSQPSHYNVP